MTNGRLSFPECLQARGLRQYILRTTSQLCKLRGVQDTEGVAAVTLLGTLCVSTASAGGLGWNYGGSWPFSPLYPAVSVCFAFMEGGLPTLITGQLGGVPSIF